MTRTADPKPRHRFLVLGTVCVVVAALYFAQEVLIPIALAILLSFLLAPLVRLLEQVQAAAGGGGAAERGAGVRR